jgi:hypothetical protein
MHVLLVTSPSSAVAIAHPTPSKPIIECCCFAVFDLLLRPAVLQASWTVLSRFCTFLQHSPASLRSGNQQRSD